MIRNRKGFQFEAFSSGEMRLPYRFKSSMNVRLTPHTLHLGAMSPACTFRGFKLTFMNRLTHFQKLYTATGLSEESRQFGRLPGNDVRGGVRVLNPVLLETNVPSDAHESFHYSGNISRPVPILRAETSWRGLANQFPVPRWPASYVGCLSQFIPLAIPTPSKS